MSDVEDYEYFKLRKEGKTYISKLFFWNERDTEGKRNVTMVLEGSDSLKYGEIQGAMCLRLTGDKRKTQITALVTQDDQDTRRITLQTFRPRAGDWIEAVDKEEFTFRHDEFAKLCEFLEQIKFVDLSNENRFQIEDISNQAGPKVIVDAPDHNVLKAIKEMPDENRKALLGSLQNTLSNGNTPIIGGFQK